jgi:hypothetical protein
VGQCIRTARSSELRLVNHLIRSSQRRSRRRMEIGRRTACPHARTDDPVQLLRLGAHSPLPGPVTWRGTRLAFASRHHLPNSRPLGLGGLKLIQYLDRRPRLPVLAPERLVLGLPLIWAPVALRAIRGTRDCHEVPAVGQSLQLRGPARRRVRAHPGVPARSWLARQRRTDRRSTPTCRATSTGARPCCSRAMACSRCRSSSSGVPDGRISLLPSGA